MKLKLIGGSDALNNTEVDAAVRSKEARIQERINDPIGHQFVIHKYEVEGDEAYWVAADFLGRQRRVTNRALLIPELLVYERASDPSTRLIVRQLLAELAKNKPVRV